MTHFSLLTLKDKPNLAEIFWPQKVRIWPEFMLNDYYADRLWGYLARAFAQHQLYLINQEGEPVAVAQTMPLVWDGSRADLPVGWADGMVRSVADFEAGRTPNTLSAIEIAINPDYQGQGLSYRMVNAVRDHAAAQGFQAVIVAVRPSMKEHYPLTPMERYVHWRRADGLPFDPWLRVHEKCGGEIVQVAHPSMVIQESVDTWERWTGMAFPDSGDYVVPGALVPVQMDRTANFGRYVEPNVWVHHPITTARLTNP